MTATSKTTTINSSSITNTDAIKPAAASHQFPVMYQYIMAVIASVIFIAIILVIYSVFIH